MLRGGILLVCILAPFACLHAADDAAADEVETTPYGGIAARNVFGLKPPPPPPAKPEPPRTPPPKLTLTGITTILGNKRALLMLQQPKQPEPEYYSLAVGQSSGEIEILAIDADAGTVTVKNHGVEQTLDFDKDGAKLAAAPPLPNVPRPGVNPAVAPARGARPAPNIPTRTLRLPPAPGSGNQ